MATATFLLAKDPATQHGGDVTMSRLVMRLAAESYDVSAICLSSATGDVVVDGLPVRRVPKPEVRATSLLARSRVRGRSLVHTRFDTRELRRVLDETDADVFVAEHSYMAESLLAGERAEERRLVVDTHVSESHVWSATRGLLGAVERPRIERDELRVARAAAAVGTFDADEAAWYRDHGVTTARLLDLTLEPAPRLDLSATGPRLAFVGVRDWPPNQDAFLEALRLWPRIAAGVPGAELLVIGAKAPGVADPVLPDGVRELGFVDDLTGTLATCRALVAPVRTGGGVRVKVLEAASLGLPVVGTGAAVGSLAGALGLEAHDSDDAFVEECRRMLLSREDAQAAGRELHDRNARRWHDRLPHRAVEDLVRASPA